MIGKVEMRLVAGPVRCVECKRIVGGYVPAKLRRKAGAKLVARRHKDGRALAVSARVVREIVKARRGWCKGSGQSGRPL